MYPSGLRVWRARCQPCTHYTTRPTATQNLLLLVKSPNLPSSCLLPFHVQLLSIDLSSGCWLLWCNLKLYVYSFIPTLFVNSTFPLTSTRSKNCPQTGWAIFILSNFHFTNLYSYRLYPKLQTVVLWSDRKILYNTGFLAARLDSSGCTDPRSSHDRTLSYSCQNPAFTKLCWPRPCRMKAFPTYN